MSWTGFKLMEPKWMAPAIAELDVKEGSPRIVEYHKVIGLKPTPDSLKAWCGIYQGYCLKISGFEPPNLPAAARSYLGWGICITQPTYGCIAVFKRGDNPAFGHVGFLCSVEGSDIVLLSGNVSNRVCVAKFPKRDLLSLRWI